MSLIKGDSHNIIVDTGSPWDGPALLQGRQLDTWMHVCYDQWMSNLLYFK